MADCGVGALKYSCKTASETLEWIRAIKDFLNLHRFFLDAHVVNFFKDRLWEAVDKEWMDCLREAPVESLLQIPSGVVQDHWSASLKEFVFTLRSLSLPREQADLREAFPGLNVASLNSVLAQGMNRKKKHEIEALAAVIGSVAGRVGANTIVDVGSGQGYLAQVLCFENELSVIAIDASSHHGSITDARAKRIKKYYAAKIRKSCSEKKGLSMPKTVTCQVLSTGTLKNVSCLLKEDDCEKPVIFSKNIDEMPLEGSDGRGFSSLSYEKDESSLILAGLHACGDLSVTMLRTFIECDEVKAVISIGCCYNLLTEKGIKEVDSQCGFPMSKGAKSANLLLGKNARDLACQSAERWKGLGKAASLHNFDLHAFRAAFQMVLFRYFPEVITQSPAIGRQGKALRRKQHRQILECNAGSTGATAVLDDELFSDLNCSNEEIGDPLDRYSMFVKFCQSGLGRLGFNNFNDIEFFGMWKEAEEFYELIGPYWTLRAAMGPVLETLLLLDRLLFLQEHGNVIEAVMLPIFDPVLSPRNLALIAKKL